MRIQTIALAILLPLFTMAETISFTYLGTNNDDLSPYHGLTMPATITIADIPEAAEFSLADSLEIFSFSNQVLTNLSQYGKGRVIASQTGELAGYELQFRYLRQNGDSFTQSGPMFILDGDDLVAGDTTAEAATGMGVSAQTGFQLKVTKVAKATTGPGSGTGTGGGNGDGTGGGTGGNTDDSANDLVLSALEEFLFDDADGTGFGSMNNTGSNGSGWNFNNAIAGVTTTNSSGNLLIGGINGALPTGANGEGQFYRKIEYGSAPYSSGTYQLEIDFDSLSFESGDDNAVVRWACGTSSATADNVAKIEAQANNGTSRIQFIVKSTNDVTVYRNFEGLSGIGMVELNLDDSEFTITTNGVALTGQALPLASGSSIGALVFAAANFSGSSAVEVDYAKFSSYVADTGTELTDPNANTDASSHWDAHPDFVGVALEKFDYNEAAGKQPFAINVSWGVANSGTTSSSFNYGGGNVPANGIHSEANATDGNGNMLFYGTGRQQKADGSGTALFRIMPKGATNGSIDSWDLETGVYSLVVDFDSWDLDPAVLNTGGTFEIGAYTGNPNSGGTLLGAIMLNAHTNGNARIQVRSNDPAQGSGVGNYRSFETALTNTNAPKIAIEFDLDNDTVNYYTNNVAWQTSLASISSSASIDSIRLGLGAQGSTNSTIKIDGIALYERQNASDIPINAVDFTGGQIGNEGTQNGVFLSGTNTLLNLDGESVLTQWDAEGDWYGQNTNLTLSGQTFYQASQHSTVIDPAVIATQIAMGGTGSTNGGHGRAALVLQSGSGIKIQEQSNNPTEFAMEAGSTSDAIILFKKDQFNGGLDSTNVTFSAAADTLSATINYGGKTRMSQGRFSWVIQDGSAFYRSSPITMTHGNDVGPGGAAVTNVTAEALDVNWYNYDPTTDVAALGTPASPTFNDIQALGYLFGCTWVGGDDDGTGTTQWARIEVSDFAAQADESVPVTESASWLSQYGLTDFTGDADEDGIVDLLEYALGLSPDASDSPAISGQNSGGYILFSHPKRAGTAHGLTYTVQTNGNLKFGDWEDHSTVNSSESGGNVTHTIPTFDSDELFIRLKVELD